MLIDFWCTVESNLPLITAMGVVATAVIALLQYRSMQRYNRPILHAWHPEHQWDQNYVLSYEMSQESGKWLITGIRIPWQWRSYLAKATVYVKEDSDLYGESGRFEHEPWCRHVRFDPPDNQAKVLLHQDAPKAFMLRFDVCLRSDPKAKNHVVMRVVITD